MKINVHGGDIYSQNIEMDFSANINPCGMPPAVAQAAVRGVEQSIHYPDVVCRRLRRATARKEQIPQDWLIFGNGAAEILFLLVQTLHPKKALVTAPGFAEYEQALRSVNCEIQYYQLTKETGFVLQEDYLSCLREDLDLIFLCNPNNPTGVCIPPSLLQQILKQCKRLDIRVVLDECFQDFLLDEDQDSQIAKLKHDSNLFLLKAFTKMYAMPGLRLGYGISRDLNLLEQMEKRIQPWNISLPAQLAGEAACDETQFVEQTQKLIAKERSFLKQELEKSGCHVFDGKANYLFFQGEEGLFKDLLEQGILIRDCSNYPGLTKGYYRIAVKTREENEKLLHALHKLQPEKGEQ